MRHQISTPVVSRKLRRRRLTRIENAVATRKKLKKKQTPKRQQRSITKKVEAELTPRETEVFDLIVNQGASNEEIARALGITTRSAKFHTGNVLRKIGAPDRLKLTVSYWQTVANKGLR